MVHAAVSSLKQLSKSQPTSVNWDVFDPNARGLVIRLSHYELPFFGHVFATTNGTNRILRQHKNRWCRCGRRFGTG
jgi:hypothetical protein